MKTFGKKLFSRFVEYHQGLIQKEKVDIDGEKGAQISVVIKKIVHKEDPKL